MGKGFRLLEPNTVFALGKCIRGGKLLCTVEDFLTYFKGDPMLSLSPSAVVPCGTLSPVAREELFHVEQILATHEMLFGPDY
jgi:hypothetical protein